MSAPRPNCQNGSRMRCTIKFNWPPIRPTGLIAPTRATGLRASTRCKSRRMPRFKRTLAHISRAWTSPAPVCKAWRAKAPPGNFRPRRHRTYSRIWLAKTSTRASSYLTKRRVWTLWGQRSLTSIALAPWTSWARLSLISIAPGPWTSWAQPSRICKARRLRTLWGRPSHT